MDDDRPDPDQLLRAIQHEEKHEAGGQLKIFLGMSAGVGKTYSMLEAAGRTKLEGVDVVVGIVETHGRTETSKLIEGLEIIPLKKVEYKGTVFEEMDLDAILKRKPELVLVDELAHTNVPGSRHPKRWQDVIELLEAGISVYTTLNVQHIESRKDIVENITGISIRETVPDLILERSHHIELIDITPVELLQRLRDGKVYLGPQSEIAAKNFFKKDRLTALRELSLRFTAEKVDHDLHIMTAETGDRLKAWKATEKILVCLSHSPHSQHLIRTARRMAFNLDINWTALHVENGVVLNDEDQAQLAKNIALARELGAEVMTITDPDIVRAIQKAAQQRHITKIILGRPLRYNVWNVFRAPNLIDRLMNETQEVDIIVIHEQMSPRKKQKIAKQLQFSSQVSAYLKIISLVIGISIFSSLIVAVTGFRVVGFIYLISILIFGLFFSQGPVLVASLLSGLIMNFLFIPPAGSYVVSAQEELYWFTILFITSVVTGLLTSRIREREAMLVKRDESTQTIYEIVRDIASAPSTPDLLVAIKARLGVILEGKCEIILKSQDGGLNLENVPNHLKEEKEIAVAAWVFNHGKEAGWSTTTLPLVQNFYIPLKGFNEIVGVMTYQPNSPTKTLSMEEINLLYTVGRQLANYVERTLSEERTRKSEYLAQVEKVYQTILKSISSEFQSPLGSLKENLKNLKVYKKDSDDRIANVSLHYIEDSAEDIGRITENIQAMSSLCAGLVNLKKEPSSIRAVIERTVSVVAKQAKNRLIKTFIPDDLPPVSFDFSLIELLLYNVLFNTIEFTNTTEAIEVHARINGKWAEIQVIDEGRQTPPEIIKKAEKFKLPGMATSTGVGLGLAIAESIAEVHQGELRVSKRESGGVEFLLKLPV